MVKPLTNPLHDRPLPLGNLMIAATKVLGETLNARMAATGFTEVRASHAPVFMGVEPDGTRLCALADRASMSKQAMGELVQHLVKHDYVTLTQDPAGICQVN